MWRPWESISYDSGVVNNNVETDESEVKNSEIGAETKGIRRHSFLPVSKQCQQLVCNIQYMIT